MCLGHTWSGLLSKALAFPQNVDQCHFAYLVTNVLDALRGGLCS